MDIKTQLSKFGEYLLQSHVVKRGSEKFYVGWLRQFFSFEQPHSSLSETDQLQLFLEALEKKPKIQDWQIKQAENAVQLFFARFSPQDSQQNGLKSTKTKEGDEETIQPDATINEFRKMLRLKHYAYRTEQTYINWVERFFQYKQQISRRPPKRCDPFQLPVYQRFPGLSGP